MLESTEPDEFITIYFEKGVRRTIRGPKGFKEAIDKFLAQLELESGAQFSRNQFFLNAARFYLRYLLQAKDLGDLISRTKESFEEVDTTGNKVMIEEEKGKE